MSIPRHTYNTLPPRPEYIKKVLKALSRNGNLTEVEIVAESGLTKTQALCALVELMKQGNVSKVDGTKFYTLTNTHKD